MVTRVADIFSDAELEAALAGEFHATDAGAESPGRTIGAADLAGYATQRNNPRARASTIDSLVEGGLQGATFGFADEIEGLATAIGQDAKSIASRLVGLTKEQDSDPTTFKERLRRNIDEARREASILEKDNPNVFLTGQVGGAIASGIGAGSVLGNLFKGANTLKTAVAGGTAAGALAGAGDSEADLLDGDVGGVALDSVKGGALGAVGGAAGHGLGKAVGAGVRKLRGGDVGAASAGARLATETAKSGDELSEIGFQQSVKDSFKAADDLERSVNDKLAANGFEPDFRLKPSQKTGDPALALKERTAEQLPATMREAQAAEAKQLGSAAKFLDVSADEIAAAPEKLGRSDVGNRLVKVIDNYMIKLHQWRSASADPIYEAAEQAAGSAPIFSTSNISKAAQEMAEGDTFSSATKKLGGKVKQLTDLADESGAVRYGALKSFRSFWTDVLAGRESLGKAVSPGKAKRTARMMLDAINDDLADSAAGRQDAGKAGLLLQQANQVWREGSERIDSAGTAVVKRILKMKGADDADTITKRLLSRSPDQIKGVFRVVNQASPKTAQQLRAQLFEEVLVKGGKPAREAVFSRAMGVSRLKPQTLLTKLKEHEPILRAAFEGDAKAMHNLKQAIELTQRLSFGPGIKGSDTAPKIAQGLKELRMSSGGIMSEGLRRTIDLASRILSREGSQARAMSSPEGLSAFNKMMRVAVGKESISKEGAAALASTMSRLGIEVEEIARDEFAERTRPEDLGLHGGI